MAYEGWFTLGGTEIVNASRTAAYIKGLLPGTRFLDICGDECGCDHLHSFLGDLPYASPMADDAPWTDPDRPESYEFLGAYPLGISNLTDGTVQALKLEGIDDGGWVNGRRNAMRDVVFSVALFSTTPAGDDYGTAWLKAALEGACADASTCNSGTSLCFLSSCVDPDTFTGRVVKTEHALADWKLYRSTWSSRTINLNDQTSWAEIEVQGSCGEIEWEITLRGEAGNYLEIQHRDRPAELHYLDGSAQTVRFTTAGTSLRIGIPDVTGMASWGEPDPPSTDLTEFARHTTTPSSVAGGTQSMWNQFTTIPLPIEIVQVVSNARFATTDDECAAEFMRYLRRVKHTDGPLTRREDRIASGGVIRTMDFILTAEMPFIYGEPALAAKGSSSDIVAMAVPYRTMRLSRNIGDCVQEDPKPVLDPLGPVIPPPPPPSFQQVSDIPELPPAKNPYAVLIPASTIPQWLNSVPIVNITAGAADVRQVRVRFFPVPLDSYMPDDIDPCSACGSFQIDYLPKGATFTFDASEQRATVSVGGIIQTAEHLISGDKGVGGAEWPLLSCGIPYMVVIDSRGQALSDVEVYMVVRS